MVMNFETKNSMMEETMVRETIFGGTVAGNSVTKRAVLGVGFEERGGRHEIMPQAAQD